MRKGIVLFALAVLSTVFLTGNAFALVNAGFETGNLSGWTSYLGGGSISVESSFDSSGLEIHYTPAEGSYFALLGGGYDGEYTTLTQEFSLNSGDSLSGAAAFSAYDYTPFYDDAYVKILNSAGGLVATPWDMGIPDVGSYGETPWQNWSWTADQSGTYYVQFGSSNKGDGALPSYGLFDLTQNVIPEPTTMSLLGLGLLGLLRFKRKK